MAGYAVEDGAVGNEGENVNIGGANGKGWSDSAWELVGRAERKRVVATSALRDYQHIGCSVHWIGRGIEG